MQDIRSLGDLGRAVSAARKSAGITTVEAAQRSGRSRDVLHRLESGRDVSAGSLLALLAAIDHRLDLVPSARPDLEAMRQRYAHLQEDVPPPADPSPSPAWTNPRAAHGRRR